MEDDEIDVDQVSSQIASELFDSDDDASSNIVENGAPSPAPAPISSPSPGNNLASTPNPGVVPGQNSVAKPLPKSWKKDMAPHWERLPNEVHEYVYAREADVMRGIQAYAEGAQNWNNLLQPFAPILKDYPEVQPIPLLQGLLNTHIRLASPSLPIEQKVQMARTILADYGLDISQLSGGTPTQENEIIQSLRSELQRTNQTVQELHNGFTQRQQHEYNQGLTAKKTEVETFAADPKNEFFEDVGNDIFRLLKTGAAADLPSAYEMACWSNPVVRVKLLAKQQQQAANPGQNRRPNGQFKNLDEGGNPGKRISVPSSVNDSVDAIISKHYPKH